MSLVAEAPLITDEGLGVPNLYVVAGEACATLDDDAEVIVGDDDLSEVTQERPRLYLVSDAAESDAPNVSLARDVPYERFTQARYKHWLGGLSIRRTVEVKHMQESAYDTSLLDKIREAKAGSAEALNMVGINVGTATTEACFKDRHVVEIALEIGDDGELFQFGQSMLSVHANALTMRPNRHPILQNITLIEALNGHRIRDGLKSGMLDDHWLLVPSIVPDGVPENELGHKGDGYFLDSLTFVLQATTKQPTGEVITQSGFMAGVKADAEASFEERIARRYDIKALARIYEQLGQEPPSTAAEFLDGGLYIPKVLMPNGVVDFMRWCDEATDEQRGHDWVRHPNEYASIIEESRRREASLADVRQRVIDDLLEAADVLETPMDAVQLMWDLVRIHTVDASFTNTYIDPRVFGGEAARHIDQVRQAIRDGTDSTLMEEERQKAQELAVISGCGGGASASEADGSSKVGSGEGSGMCTFISKECPMCGAKNVITVSSTTYVKGITCGCLKKKLPKTL